MPAASGAGLRCVFQRLAGEAIGDGLWLTSTVTNSVHDRFRVVAAAVGRAEEFGMRRQSTAATPLSDDERMGGASLAPESGVALRFPPQSKALPRSGTVEVVNQTARFIRPGLVEEYSVSMGGVRQDFVIVARPEGSGELRVSLAVDGARVEPAAGGARLVRAHSGRKIAYNRLRVTDATGRELPARVEVVGGTSHRPVPSGDPPDRMAVTSERKPATLLPANVMPVPLGESPSGPGGAPVLPRMLAVRVNDAEAVYPVRVDPTFSDANWMSMGGIPGALGAVRAAVGDGSGNLYIGGDFTVVGDVIANHIAKWNGSRWTALGSGMGGASSPYVYALAVSGSDLYTGGNFTTAGGKVSAYIARAYLLTLPALSMRRSGPDVMVSWPSADTADFKLEHVGALASPASWAANAASITNDGSNKSVTLPATNSPQFFRLR